MSSLLYTWGEMGKRDRTHNFFKHFGFYIIIFLLFNLSLTQGFIGLSNAMVYTWKSRTVPRPLDHPKDKHRKN